MPTKQELIQQLLKDPVGFTHNEFLQLVGPPEAANDPDVDNPDKRINFDDLHQMLLRIYDINEKSFMEESDASTGMMGFFNRLSTKARQRKYRKLVRNGFRLQTKLSSGRSNKIIVAEGDSWFQFPVFIKDIIDWLMTVPNHAIYSMAYGGSWISNIIYEGKYIEELSIHAPDVFLISGSGNDLVGSDRVAIMVDKSNACKRYTQNQFSERYSEWDSTELEKMWAAQQYITNSFYAFLWVIKMQYWIMFKGIGRSVKLQHTMIITQGYDYPIPSLKKHFSWRYPLEWFVNAALDSGHWLAEPLLIKGIPAVYHRYLLLLFISEMNEVFIDLAHTFKQVYHIDARGVAADKDWWDELHLKDYKFKQVAAAYDFCINENAANNKVVRAVDFISNSL